MPRPRSLIVSMTITSAGRAHGCRQNDAHKIVKGDPRLTIKSDGDDHHYCLSCAQKFLEADIVNLRRMLDDIEALRVPSSSGTSAVG